jgi:nucleoside-diphosphate-sugar epimerase
MTAPLQVVLGAGQIATHLTQRLLARGVRVRQVRRSSASTPDDSTIERRSGDLADPRFAAEVMKGAAVAYDCTVPPYERWSSLLLPLGASIVDGAVESGAALVAFDNVYLYGQPRGPLREDTPIAPCSKKGELRAKLHALRWSAHQQRGLRLSVGRASDLFGPGVTLTTILNERFYQRFFSGKSVDCVGDPDAPHSYSYAPDVADALVTLGHDERAWGQVWHLPLNAAESTRSLVARLARAANVDPKVNVMPSWMLSMLGLFVAPLREVVEMQYQWRAPFVLDDQRFRSTFGALPTEWDVAARETVAWARDRFARR